MIRYLKSIAQSSLLQFNPRLITNQPKSMQIAINRSLRSQVYCYENQNENEENYKIINELSVSDYFGEVSLITNLPATATVHAISNTIWWEMSKQDFINFLDNFTDSRQRIENRIQNYSDNFF